MFKWEVGWVDQPRRADPCARAVLITGVKLLASISRNSSDYPVVRYLRRVCRHSLGQRRQTRSTYRAGSAYGRIFRSTWASRQSTATWVRGFFENGGQGCYVVPLEDNTAPSLQKGLKAIAQWLLRVRAPQTLMPRPGKDRRQLIRLGLRSAWSASVSCRSRSTTPSRISFAGALCMPGHRSVRA